jgi:hypothetical protein
MNGGGERAALLSSVLSWSGGVCGIVWPTGGMNFDFQFLPRWNGARRIGLETPGWRVRSTALLIDCLCLRRPIPKTWDPPFVSPAVRVRETMPSSKPTSGWRVLAQHEGWHPI